MRAARGTVLREPALPYIYNGTDGTRVRTVPPTCASDCAYAMNPASDINGRMVCSWLLYMSRHAVSMLTLRHTHSLTALHSLRWHMALAQTSRTHNMQTVQRREGGWEAHRRDAEGSRGRVAGEGTTVMLWCSTISRLSTSSDARPARARISHILLRPPPRRIRRVQHRPSRPHPYLKC